MTTAEKPLFDAEPEGLEGINAFYRQDLLPGLTTLEARRRRAKTGAKEGLSRFLVPIWILCGIVVVVWQSYLLLLPVALLTGFAFYYTYRDSMTLEQRHKALLVGGLAGFLGFFFKARGLPNLVPYYQMLGLLPEPTEVHCENGVVGLSEGVEFQLTGIRFQAEPGWEGAKGAQGTIRATLVTVRVPNPFPEKVTIVSKRAGDLWRTLSRMEGMPPTRLENPGFRDAFHVFAHDRIAARDLLPAATLERLIGLSERYGDFRACFQDRAMHIVFGSATAFDAGKGGAGFTDPQIVYDVLGELYDVKRLVGTLAPVGTR